MYTITFECEIITPMFLAGADGAEPELRAPSIKGALRFWWRALNGNKSIEELRKEEAQIFGGTDEKVGRSKIIIKTTNIKLMFSEYKPVPHKNFQISAFDANIEQTFQVSLSLSSIQHNFDLQKLESLFILTCLFGGLGKRSRRGFGSIKITKTKKDEKDFLNFNMPNNLNDILNYIKILNKDYNIASNKITIDNTKLSNYKKSFPYIEEVKVGQKKYTSINDLVTKIGNATHTHKNENPSLGYAEKSERLASPVYASALKISQNDYRTIITTLYMVTKNGAIADKQKQENFKNAIL